MTTYEQFRREEQDARDRALLLEQPLDLAVLAVSTDWQRTPSRVTRILAAGYFQRTFVNDVLPATEHRHQVMERGS